MPSVVLGVDIGTTATKVVAFDADGREYGDATIGYPLDEPRPGQAVQDPDRILRAVVGAVRETAQSARAAGAEIAGLAFCAAMHTLIALDAAGRPLTPSITWGDTRAADQAERLRAAGPALHRRTGTPLHPMSPLAKLMWFRERDPDTFAAARRWVGHQGATSWRACAASGWSTTRSPRPPACWSSPRSTGTRRRCALAGVERGAALPARPDHPRPARAHRRRRARARPAGRHAGGGRRLRRPARQPRRRAPCGRGPPPARSARAARCG